MKGRELTHSGTRRIGKKLLILKPQRQSGETEKCLKQQLREPQPFPRVRSGHSLASVPKTSPWVKATPRESFQVDASKEKVVSPMSARRLTDHSHLSTVGVRGRSAKETTNQEENGHCLSFAVVTLHEVAVNPELVKSEPLLQREKTQGQGPASLWSLHFHQSMSLFGVCFCTKTANFIGVVDSLTLNPRQQPHNSLL